MIVTHNRCETLRRGLQLLGSAHQILVVDNGSTDGTSATLEFEFPRARFIRLPKNFGLTKALNIGIRAADGTYILLLHDDTLIAEGVVSALADYLEAHIEAGCVAPLLTDETGSPMPQVRPLPTSALPDPPYAPATAATAPCLLGAAVMYRAFFLRAIRQIDERYGTYGPDIELAWQVGRGGKKAVVLQDLKAVHLAMPSSVKQGTLNGDRVAGTAAFLGTHVSLPASLLYRFTTGLLASLTIRFSVAAGAFLGQKIDGTN